jgi:anaerobic dimethyl sulfoxide reductase subunit B (iron-sulfur subunit)
MTAPPPVRQYGFFFDSSLCSGCKACQGACQDKNGLPAGTLWRRVIEIAGGGWKRENGLWRPDVFAYYLSAACHHCLEPPCLPACTPGLVIKRDDGIVLIDDADCNGCRACEYACPYGAIRYDAVRNKVGKCDFCLDKIAAGEPPACVSACPMRALDFGDLDVLRAKRGGTAAVFPLPDPGRTRPALLIKPHRDAARASQDTAEVANWEEI